MRAAVQPSESTRLPTVHICLTKGVGSGPTEVAAFDAALGDAGIANYNLVRLSSVIPAGARLDAPPPVGDWGDRLYVVYASDTATVAGAEAWAGIGWCRRPDGSGIFVEHGAPSQERVKHLIAASLEDMVRRRGGSFSAPEMEVVGIACVDRPVCALVAATYGTEPWA
jgi:arginine decarboxylase